MTPPRPGPGRSILEVLAAPAVCQALAGCAAFYALATAFVRELVSWPGSAGILAALIILCGGSLAGQWPRVEWHGILPISLLIFFSWMTLSIAWSQYPGESFAGVLYALGFAFLGVYLALGRDVIQAIRAVGDALRVILVLSLGLEVLAGLVLQRPIAVFQIGGTIADLGPITGIGGTRNYLGYLACLALATFLVEVRTRILGRGLAIASVGAAVLTLVLVRSPVTLVVLLVLAVAAVALWALRRVPPKRRPIAQIALGAVIVAGIVGVALLRLQLIGILRAGSDFDTRADQWSSVLGFAAARQLQGWGWIGIWDGDLYPFDYLSGFGDRRLDSALNAGIDTYLQVGVIGVLLLAAAFLLAGTRAWLVGVEHPSTAYAWPALVLVLIAVTGLVQSYLLFEGSLMLFVYCSIAAARKRSWRHRLSAPLAASRD